MKTHTTKPMRVTLLEIVTN